MTDREMLRHTLATLAYRAAKAMRGAPASFADFKLRPDSNTPVQLAAHMGDLFDWALTIAKGEARWHAATPQVWEKEIARFFGSLKAFDDYLASGAPINAEMGRVFQGPIADALTHTGQLALLRRAAGCPMKGENYSKAEIVIGRVSFEQTPPKPEHEFD
ncbi:hypothetical protein C3F09_11265 [candidate division GN15 bacterium]|uniref:DinB family protein n=1 Tax=candidate division GN15 bacterium TaxID=2072418 RepID=A0A855X2P3_9BACT|nr:MAG: hypothetical protein C3F09_11265 [candidate division GN15 bacterium]